MNQLFLSILNMSYTASYVIIIVVLIRQLLKKTPKIISYGLWGVVAFRLLCPFSFESMFSLLPVTTTPIPRNIAYEQNPQINSGIHTVDTFINDSLPTPIEGASVNPLQIYIQIGAYLWMLGMILLLIYSFVSIILLKRQLKNASWIEKNIYEANNLKTPFVLGSILPKIYLPAGLSSEEQHYILLHEQIHIRRCDHIIKILAFCVLSIHWFNPLVWIAFRLMSTDMELSCDERALKEMDEDIKKPYATSLLSLAAGKHILNGSPLAFGEGNVKGRIKNVLNYKKTALWVIVLAIFVVATISIGLLTNPKQKISLTDHNSFPSSPQFDKIVSAELIGQLGDNTASATITNKEGNFGWGQLPIFLETVIVEKKEVNRSRDESRDKTHQIILNRQIDNSLLPLTFNFNSDFSEIWIDDDVKAGFSYYVVNTDDVAVYFNAVFLSLSPNPVSLIKKLSFTTEETSLKSIGTIAFEKYMSLKASDETPVEERIDSYQLNEIYLLVGDIKDFSISINYDFTTNNDYFISPGRGEKGKGTWSDNYMEIRIKNINEDNYEIVEIGTGGGEQDLEPTRPTTLPLTTDLEQSISNAILSYYASVKSWYPWYEVAGEGHITLDKEEKAGFTYAYIMERYCTFGFENGILTGIGGHGSLATIVFEKDSDKNYVMTQLTRASDGGDLGPSVKKMFSASAYDKWTSANSEESKEIMDTQAEAYARAYLETIGRKADVQIDLKDKIIVDINVDVSNYLVGAYGEYPYWIGTREVVENGIRYVYEKSWQDMGDQNGIISFIKSIYEGDVVEKTVIEVKGSEMNCIEGTLREERNIKYN